jgi:hypothetical protein
MPLYDDLRAILPFANPSQQATIAEAAEQIKKIEMLRAALKTCRAFIRGQMIEHAIIDGADMDTDLGKFIDNALKN